MNNTMTFLVALLTVLLIGCGTSVKSTPAQPLTVSAYGDSTMFGALDSDGLNCSPGHEAPDNEPATAARILSVPVNNYGVCGITSVDLLAGTAGVGHPFQERIYTDPSTVIVVNVGINDVRLDVGADTYASDLQAIVSIVRTAGKTIVLDTPNPAVAGGQFVTNLTTLAEYVQIMKTVGQENGVPVCDQYDTIRAAGYATLQYIPDGVHPTDTLYKFKGTTLAGCLGGLQ